MLAVAGKSNSKSTLKIHVSYSHSSRATAEVMKPFFLFIGFLIHFSAGLKQTDKGANPNLK